jgi:transposase
MAARAGRRRIVVDSASIEVNRRARRAKNDRLDGDKLLAMLLRWHGGERGLWSVLRAPTAEQEDARRVERELDRLTSERTAHMNRIGSLLVMHNLRAGCVGGRAWGKWWSEHAQDVAPALRSEIERELERLALVQRQVKLIDAGKQQEVADNKHPLVAALSRLRSIGPVSVQATVGSRPSAAAVLMTRAASSSTPRRTSRRGGRFLNLS